MAGDWIGEASPGPGLSLDVWLQPAGRAIEFKYHAVAVDSRAARIGPARLPFEWIRAASYILIEPDT